MTKKADYNSEDGQQRSEKQKSEEKGTVKLYERLKKYPTT